MAAAGVLLVALAIVLPNAWMADDAYITLRTVDHFCNGRGLVYNIGERVQAYTHPLWMFVLAGTYCATGAHYWGTITLGVVFSLLALGSFVLCHGRHPAVSAALALALLGSRAFVDFSTSGLENPLVHLLLVVFYAIFFREEGRRWRHSLLALALATSAILLSRTDAGLLVLPAFGSAMWRQHQARSSRGGVLGPLALGMAPWLAWEAFSLVYYGVLVPNTALAKLSTGVPRSALVQQGFRYVLDGLARDPWTLLIMTAGMVAAFVRPAGGRFTLGLGLVLHLTYVVLIGGDYMSGRFFTAPCLVGCVALARAVPQTSRVGAGLAVAAAFGAFLAVRPTWSHDIEPRESRFGAAWDDASGVVDEQVFWYRWTGVLNARKIGDMPASKGRSIGERSPPGSVVEVGTAGMIGFFAPPDVYVLDHFALVDAFLARIPALPDFKPGHFRRDIPEGYRETVATGVNVLQDPRLRRLYHDVHELTRGPLLRVSRLRAMGRLHLSRY